MKQKHFSMNSDMPCNNLLSNITYPGSSIPRDFVELPSQIMEHWVLEPEVLKVYAKHYQTGEVIPAGNS